MMIIHSSLKQTPGDFDPHPPPSKIKRFQQGKTMSRDECIRRLGTSAVPELMHADVMCTNIPSCHHDYGNALIAGNNVLVGLMSLSKELHRRCGSPDIHVRIFSHVPWIRSTVQALYN